MRNLFLSIGCAALMSGLVAAESMAAESRAVDRSSAGVSSVGTVPVSKAQIEKILRDNFANYEASFVLLNLKSGEYTRLNPGLCRRRLAPCSTFKIFNALTGLDLGILKDADTTFKWDGVKREIDSWNSDQTLKSAMQNSAVWYFQRLATMIGDKRMQHYLHAVPYGNEDMSAGLTKFWLGNSLTISGEEQVSFLKRLKEGKLPFSPHSIATVKEVIKLRESEGATLYGKTGTDRENGKNILGWFVGFVERPDTTFVFAANIQPLKNKPTERGAYGPLTRNLTIKVLKDLLILPEKNG